MHWHPGWNFLPWASLSHTSASVTSTQTLWDWKGPVGPFLLPKFLLAYQNFYAVCRSFLLWIFFILPQATERRKLLLLPEGTLILFTVNCILYNLALESGLCQYVFQYVLSCPIWPALHLSLILREDVIWDKVWDQHLFSLSSFSLSHCISSFKMTLIIVQGHFQNPQWFSNFILSLSVKLFFHRVAAIASR